MSLSYDEIKAKVLDCVPKVCPECGAPLVLSENLMHLTCTNPDCGGKVYRKIEIAAKALGIDFIGPGVAKELVDHLNVHHVWQLFDFTEDDFLMVPRYQDGMASRLYQSIQAHRDASFAQFIRACQFKRVGEGTANDLASKYDSLEALLNTTPDELISRMGSMTIQSAGPICESIQESKEDVMELSKRINLSYPAPVQQGTNPTGKELICVVTGPLGFGSRPEFQSVFGASYGIKWGSSVTSKTDVLVTNETTPTGKYKKAQELQAAGGKIKIMNEEEFLAFIGAEHTSTADVRLEVTRVEVAALKSFDDQDVVL